MPLPTQWLQVGLLVLRYQSQLRLWAHRLCDGDAHLADDLAQEAFIKAYAALGAFRAESKFSTWLYRIAFNIAANRWRGKHSSDDDFDVFLTRNLQQAQTYLPDDDFSARVMQQLPAPKKLSLWQERLIILIPLSIISLVVLSQFSVLALIIKIWTWLSIMDFTSILQIGILTTVTVIGGAGFWFAKQLNIIE